MEVNIKPQKIRYEFFHITTNQVLDLGNPAEIDFLNYSIDYTVGINGAMLLTTKQRFDTDPNANPYDWRHKFSAYPNEINSTQYNVLFTEVELASPKKRPFLLVICKYYVYN